AVDRDGSYEPVAVEPADPFAAELRNLVSTIRGLEVLRVPPGWGRHIVEALLAAQEASRSGRGVAGSPCGRPPSGLGPGMPSGFRARPSRVCVPPMLACSRGRACILRSRRWG